MSKLIKLARSFSLVLTLSSTAALAQQQICSTCTPSNLGDLVHRDSSWDAAFVGHAGFKTESIVDVTPGRPNGEAMSLVSLPQFIAGQAFWGGKMLLQAPRRNTMTADAWIFWTARVNDKLSFLARFGVSYDYAHLSQKGGQRADGRFTFDCVGFTEHMWEYLGYNPTDASFESGSGWPLTPREQRDSRFVMDSLPTTL